MIRSSTHLMILTNGILCLEQYGLKIIRLATTYIQKIFCYSNSPSNLANVYCFTVNNDLNKSYNLRNLLELKVLTKGKYNV